MFTEIKHRCFTKPKLCQDQAKSGPETHTESAMRNFVRLKNCILRFYLSGIYSILDKWGMGARENEKN